MKLIKNILKKKWIKWLLIVFTSVLVFFLTLYFSVYLGLFGKVPNIKELSFIKQEEATQVLDKDGQLIGKFYIYDRQPLHFKDYKIDFVVDTGDCIEWVEVKGFQTNDWLNKWQLAQHLFYDYIDKSKNANLVLVTGNAEKKHIKIVKSYYC